MLVGADSISALSFREHIECSPTDIFCFDYKKLIGLKSIAFFGKKVLTKLNFGVILRESRDEIFEKGGKRK